MSKSIELLINETYLEYRKIKYVSCPAFQNERVFFNAKGFRHLLRKGRSHRQPRDILRRLRLVKYAPVVITKETTYDNYSSANGVRFWKLSNETILANQKIIIIIRQIEGGSKTFLSVMNANIKSAKAR